MRIGKRGGSRLWRFLAGLVLATFAALALATAALSAKTLAGDRARPDAGAPPPVTSAAAPVPNLDLTRFAGTWYVIATIPDRFHEDCAAEATFTFSLQPDRSLRVQNRCRGADDSIHLDEGVAREKQPGALAGQLEVRYAPDWMTWMPLAWSEFWVIHLAGDYRHALVATPDGEHLWLLSRSPVLGEPDYRELLDQARAQGFDLERLREIPQEGGSATSVEEGVGLPAP
ncbi:MAG: lipocalin family protein [Moraxellaceae bacterium]|jgi:apolipoprotein D and lipocalin family protein|nr:lipocalin family protein [Moraxellaceae bacterium]